MKMRSTRHYYPHNWQWGWWEGSVSAPDGCLVSWFVLAFGPFRAMWERVGEGGEGGEEAMTTCIHPTGTIRIPGDGSVLRHCPDCSETWRITATGPLSILDSTA